MKLLRILAMATATALVAVAPLASVHASGSIGGGAQSGMRLGQSVYARKIACNSCKFPGGLRDDAQVMSAKAMIESGEIMLSATEKRAVVAFINKRFKGM